MRVPLIKGREFGEQDARKAPKVAIVNETLARRYFPDEDPIGKRVTLEDDNPTPESWATIVGVVGDTKPRSLDREPVAETYSPYTQETEPFMALMIRTTADSTKVAAAVRNEVEALDKDQPVYSVRTLSSIMSESVATPRFRTLLLGIFAAVALILAAVGIYGVISYSVTQRTHEIGIRMALGAQASDVLRLVVGHGLLLALAGVAIGLVASFFLTQLLSGLLFGVSATDTLTFVVISVLLTGVALAASFVPARRAMKVDPMVALRYE
jgi:putative ABC transport system permease protein